MKKFNVLIKIFVLMMIASFTEAIYVNAKSGETLTIDSKTYIQTGLDERVEGKFHTTKGYAFCITPHKTGAKEGTVLSYTKEETDGGILYLLDKAGTSDMDYLKTQIALWIYDSNYLPAIYEENSNSVIVQEAKNLANAASKYKSYRVNPTISVDHNGISVSLVKVGNTYYYQTSEIAINITNADTYTVTLANAPAGTQLLNVDGTATSGTFKKGEKFIIRVPENSVTGNATINFNAKATGVRKYVERYSPANTTYQDVAILRTENVTVTANGIISVTAPKRVCQVFNGKYYGSNGAEVTEQEYKDQCLKICKVENGKYYGSNGKEVTEQEYKDQCLKICKVENGKYYGSNGKEVTEQEYRNQCLKICKVENGKYYGSNGTEVTEQEYRNQCLKICKVENGKYYGSNGTEVTEQEYRNQCMPKTTVVVPNTGSNSSSTNLVVGSLLILGGIGITLKHRKEKNN